MENNPIHIIRKEKCSVGHIMLRSDKILMIKPFEEVIKYNLNDLKEQYEIFMDVTKGVPHLFISDVSNLKNFGTEERTFVSNTIHHFASACAIVENSTLIRFIVHSSLYIYQASIPLKMFKTEDAAINWLKEL